MTNSKGSRKRKFLRKRKRKIANLMQCGFQWALFSLALAASVERSLGEIWREGYAGHGTTHEQLGQEHWPPTNYTIYRSAVSYTEDRTRNATFMRFIYNVTHSIFDSIFTDDAALPPGYVVVKHQDTLALGPKVEQNDWTDLLTKYRLILLWIFVLLFFIILMPFIGVFYCCFCCCLRCRQGCPPCDAKKNDCRLCCCGICLFLLILGLIFGLIIAFVSNKLMDRGFHDTAYTIRRGGVDTCAFLKDISDHVYHLFVLNYEELEAHVIDELNNADKHIFLDLTDVSEGNALDELERIYNNMPEALALMRQVDILEKEMRFYGSQLRDALRGLKRDINFGTHSLCGLDKCYRLLSTKSVEFLDTSKCLHVDIIPNTTIYVEAMEAIVELHAATIPQEGIVRLQAISEKIKKFLYRITPNLKRNIQTGKETFIDQSTIIRNLIDAVTSDVYLNTLHSTQSFEDVYQLFGTQRTIVSIIILLLILLIICVLIAGLICGCCGAKTGSSGCSRATGGLLMLVAIMLIFCVFSFIMLVGLFYFVIGTITYEGACAPLRDQKKNALFRQFDSAIDLNRYMSKKTKIGGRADGKTEELELPPMRLSSAIDACSANQSIFDMLLENNLYNVEELKRIHLMPEDKEMNPLIKFDVHILIFTEEEKAVLNLSRQGDMADYHSKPYVSNLCTKFTPISLASLGEDFAAMGNEIYGQSLAQGTYSFRNDEVNAKAYANTFIGPLTNIIEKIKEKLEKIDKLILFENLPFGASIEKLVDKVLHSEKFIKDRGKNFINELSKNLTDSIRNNVEYHIDMVIRESNDNVGRCAPLAYIYYTGVDLICHRLVDPLNGFWFGLLLCTLLFLPILFVAHRLMCLYRIIYPPGPGAIAVVVLERGCPVCTGAEYVPQPVLTCGGGQQAYCGCDHNVSSREHRSKRSRLGAGTLNGSEQGEQQIADFNIEIKVEEPTTTSKHKRD